MMDGASSLVERIRGLVLSGGGDAAEIAAIAERHAALVREANALLARCHGWVQRGCASEAVALGHAVQLARSAAALRLEGMRSAWARLLEAARIAPPAEVDETLLEAFVAAAGTQESLAAELAAMRHAALRRAPLGERLGTLRVLADREPRQPAWLHGIRQLEREAVASLAAMASQAERDGDAELAERVIVQLDALTLPVEEHHATFERVRRMAEADRLLRLQREARACIDRLHAAAAAMDMGALDREAASWRELVARGAADSLAAEAAGPLDLLRRHQETIARGEARRAATARLELALDSAEPLDRLDRLAREASNLDAPLPADLENRLRERRAQHAAAVARRRALVGAVALVAVASLSVAGWALLDRWNRQERLASAIVELDRLSASGELDSADRLAREVSAEPALAERAEFIAALQRVEAARALAARNEADAAALVAELGRMSAEGADPRAMEAKAREVVALVDRMPRARQAEVRAAIARLQSAAAASREQALDASRSALHAFEGRLSSIPDPVSRGRAGSDPKALAAAAEALEALAAEARQAAAASAGQRDGQSTAEAMQGLATRAQQRAEALRQRLQRVERVRDALARLERPQADEQATLDLWEGLLRDGGDLLAERGLLRDCESARDAARAGVAIRAWRTGVVPGALAGRGGVDTGLEQLDWGDAATARNLERLLGDHLARHAETPYREVAESLLAAAQRTTRGCGSEASLGAALAAAMRESGYGGLLEQPFEGGRTLYRRGSRPAARWADAIESKRDLSKPPEALVERKPPGFRETAGSRPWPAAVAVDEALASLARADGRQARDAMLRLLARLRDPRGGDEVLQWHAMRDLWGIWARLLADERDPVDAAAAKWVRGLDASTSLLGTDPVLFGQQAAGAPKEALRRQAAAQLSGSFDVSRLVEAAARRDALLARGVRPVAPAALLLPRADGSGEVAGLPNGQRGFVPARRTGAWVLVPMRVEGGQVEWMDAPPETAVAWPQTIFIEGGAR